jgi:hypothetical protein
VRWTKRGSWSPREDFNLHYRVRSPGVCALAYEGNSSSTWSRLEDSNPDPPVIGRMSCRWTKPGSGPVGWGRTSMVPLKRRMHSRSATTGMRLAVGPGFEPGSFRVTGGRVAVATTLQPTDRCRSPAQRHSSAVKEPALASWWAAARDSNPNAPFGRTVLQTACGPSARTALWRQRLDSNPDPRALEARMLPLHHAADVTSRLDRLRDRASLRPGGPSPDARPKQKGLPGDRPGRPVSR